MPIYEVEVEKQEVIRGRIQVEADSQEAAGDIIEARIASGVLQTISPEITWDEEDYVNHTFIVKE